jgi:hypothetical protein
MGGYRIDYKIESIYSCQNGRQLAKPAGGTNHSSKTDHHFFKIGKKGHLGIRSPSLICGNARLFGTIVAADQ